MTDKPNEIENAFEDWGLCSHWTSLYKGPMKIAFEAGYKAAMKWRPMETAPKDGTRFLAKGNVKFGAPVVLYWSNFSEGFYFAFDGTYADGIFTGWFPIGEIE